MAKAENIDGYISQFLADVQAVLQEVRETIRQAAPDATETISYMKPAFRQHGILVYFAAWKKHVGLYPPISHASWQGIAMRTSQNGVLRSSARSRV